MVGSHRFVDIDFNLVLACSCSFDSTTDSTVASASAVGERTSFAAVAIASLETSTSACLHPSLAAGRTDLEKLDSAAS